MGYYVFSKGATGPFRVKIRSASFASMQALTVALPGTPVDRLADAVMSFPMVMGDVDR